jgi:hypothetical protein
MTFQTLRTFLLVAVCFLGGPLWGQSQGKARVSATIKFANGKSITMASNSKQIFDPVEVLPDEALSISLRLPPSFVNTNVVLQADGGRAPEMITVAADGSTAFVFRTGSQPGPNRL